MRGMDVFRITSISIFIRARICLSVNKLHSSPTLSLNARSGLRALCPAGKINIPSWNIYRLSFESAENFGFT